MAVAAARDVETSDETASWPAAVEPWRRPEPILRSTEGASASVFFRSRSIEGPTPLAMASASSNGLSEPDDAHATGEISVLMRNDLDHQATLWGQWGVEAQGFVPGAPEPSAHALMLAGIGLVGWATKRRSARQPHPWDPAAHDLHQAG